MAVEAEAMAQSLVLATERLIQMSQELVDIKETLKTQGALIDQLIAQKNQSAASLADEIKSLIFENNAKITASLSTPLPLDTAQAPAAPAINPQTPLPAS